MAGSVALRRKRAEIDRDKNVIARLYLRGVPVYQMPEMLQDITKAQYRLNVTHVVQHITAIRNAWRHEMVLDFNEARQRELAKIDELERTYYEAWEASKTAVEVRTVKKMVPGTDDQRIEVDEHGDLIAQPEQYREVEMTEMTRGEPVGDIRFLEGVRWCIERRIKLLGLNAPIKVAPTDPTGQKEYGEDREQLNEKKAQILIGILEAHAKPKSSD